MLSTSPRESVRFAIKSSAGSVAEPIGTGHVISASPLYLVQDSGPPDCLRLIALGDRGRGANPRGIFHRRASDGEQAHRQQDHRISRQPVRGVEPVEPAALGLDRETTL